MENSMQVILFVKRHFSSKEGTPLTEIMGLNLDSNVFFSKIMSAEEEVKFGLDKDELYFKGDNKVVVKLILSDDGFSKKVIGSKVIGEGEFEVVLSEEEVDEQLGKKK